MAAIAALARHLADDPLGTLAELQKGRSLWLAGAGAAVALELFSVLWFQWRLGMLPCEYCVQIRLDVMAVALGGLMAAAAPKVLAVKAAGWLLSFGAAAVGLKNSLVLEAITVRTLHDPDYFPVCRPGKVDFLFGLKFDQWLPTFFRPDGICGEYPWVFLHLTQSQWLVIVFVLMLVSLGLVMAASLMVRPGGSPGGLSAAGPAA